MEEQYETNEIYENYKNIEEQYETIEIYKINFKPISYIWD